MDIKNKSLSWPIAALSFPVILEKRANARREEMCYNATCNYMTQIVPRTGEKWDRVVPCRNS